jgi:hypothetical protein
MKSTLCAARLVLRFALAPALPLILLPGCTQMPTEKQSVSDMRPQISFKTVDAQRHVARVVVDGLDMGSLGAYLDGSAALRIVPGTHELRVLQGTQVLLNEKFYLGEGVNRTFTIQ